MKKKHRVDMIQSVSLILFIGGLALSTALPEQHSAWRYVGEAIAITIVPPFAWAGVWAAIDTLKERRK
jgi:hypothetical protein